MRIGDLIRLKQVDHTQTLHGSMSLQQRYLADRLVRSRDRVTGIQAHSKHPAKHNHNTTYYHAKKAKQTPKKGEAYKHPHTTPHPQIGRAHV